MMTTGRHRLAKRIGFRHYQGLAIPVVVLLTGCQALPVNPRLATPIPQNLTTQDPVAQNPIAQNPATQNLVKKISNTPNPDPKQLSGYYPLLASSDAFAARSVLTGLSQHSIDVQYYIWHNDAAGQLMLKDLYAAAQRGVKVRLLLDDLNTNPTLDQLLLAFANQPNIQVRLINPKTIRAITAVNFLTSLPRYQRRMHNKSMTFDHQLSIIGGRNIGDEYLRPDTQTAFADVDVLLAGKVVSDVEQSFAKYWDSPLSYDIHQLVKPKTAPLASADVDAAFFARLTQLAPTNPTSSLTQSSQLYQQGAKAVVDGLMARHALSLRWQPMQFVVDDANKLTGRGDPTRFLVEQVRRLVGTPKQRFSIISSYFVPSPLGVAELQQLAHDGVKIQVLTNSFASTDVPIVHAGYTRSRRALAQAGVALYELKNNADPDLRRKKHHLSHNKISTSLHTKAFAVDEKAAFIGSYNIDPRSANINSELGVVIFDKQLANAIHHSFDTSLLNIAYRVTLGQDQRLTWLSRPDNLTDNARLPKRPISSIPKPAASQQTEPKEPRLNWYNQLWIESFSYLPIISLL